MSKSLNIGLVGSGFMGQAHADAYRRARILYRDLAAKPELYAIADQNAALAEEARARFGFENAYGDWRQLVEDPKIDLVDITTPNFLHVEVALAALEARKTCLLRKTDGSNGGGGQTDGCSGEESWRKNDGSVQQHQDSGRSAG